MNRAVQPFFLQVEQNPARCFTRMTHILVCGIGTHRLSLCHHQHQHMATKHTATHSSGATATRTSKNRTYTHAVWAYEPVTLLERRLRSDISYNDKQAAFYRKQEAAGGYNYQHTPTHAVWTTAEECAKYASGCEMAASKARNELAAGVKAGSPFVVGWCGRADLADRLASQNSAKGFIVEITSTTIL